METKTKALLNEALKLSKSERVLLIDELRKYDSNSLNEQINLRNDIQKSLGPTSLNKCAVCGK